VQLDEIRQKYSDMLAGNGKTAASDINALLNGAYQFTLPRMIPGQIREGMWTLETVAGTDTYTYPSHIISPRPGGRLSDDTLLEFWTSPGLFWNRYQRSSAPQARPYAGLFYGREVVLRPVPNAVYTLHQPAAVGAVDALSSDTDTIDDYDHAMCVATLAALETCEELELVEIQAQLERRLQRYLIPFRRASLARPRQRKQRRDF